MANDTEIIYRFNLILEPEMNSCSNRPVRKRCMKVEIFPETKATKEDPPRPRLIRNINPYFETFSFSLMESNVKNLCSE
jgi:hypothetical protein